MEPAAALPGLPFKKKLRTGQKSVVDALDHHPNQLNAKLPTGYGKTFTACCVFSLLQQRGQANRMLYVVANTSQLDQFCNDAHRDLADAGVIGPHKIMDVGFYDLRALLNAHRRCECQVFVITIQALRERRGMDAVKSLMETGQWMTCVDEYHHYGITKSWGTTVLTLVRAFLLAMSATPSRPDDDSAFGDPDVSVTYRQAEEERAVKPLRGHAYNYRVEFEADGQRLSYTTKELAELAGGDQPGAIEDFCIDRKMRWSPDYISPLVCIPIERMLGERIATGFRLQALIRAMCVSHAELVCTQVREMFPELTVEWVGTGTHGRKDEENASILKRFCPPKGDDGKRPDSDIDVLVHVGMAGEGLDSVMVSEIVHAASASLNNRNIQDIGRAARYLPSVIAHVNFDASSELAEKGYVGAAIMDAMDYAPPEPDDEGDTDKEPGERDDEYDPLPDEPTVHIYRMELVDIDSGDEGVQRMARLLREHDPKAFDYDGLIGANANPDHPQWQDIIRLWHGMRAAEAKPLNEKATIAKLRSDVDGAVAKIVGLVLKKMGLRRSAVHRSLPGKIKNEINKRKKQLHGEIGNDEPLLRRHYGWVKQLEREIIENGLPAWLAHLSK